MKYAIILALTMVSNLAMAKGSAHTGAVHVTAFHAAKQATAKPAKPQKIKMLKSAKIK